MYSKSLRLQPLSALTSMANDQKWWEVLTYVQNYHNLQKSRWEYFSETEYINNLKVFLFSIKSWPFIGQGTGLENI